MSPSPIFSIKEPCHESWAVMIPTDLGRFCNACSKTVIDFTTYSDAELIAFFSKRETRDICGKFTNGQLHQEKILLQKPAKKSFVWSLILFFSMLFSQSASAQTLGKVSTTTVIPQDLFQDVMGEIHKVRGIITNGLGHPISNAVIKLFPSKLQFTTTASGEFSFDLPESTKYLFVEAVGYKAMRLNSSERRYMKVQMKEDFEIKGEVMVIQH